MKVFLLFVFLFASVVVARENPFRPTDSAKDLVSPTRIKEQRGNFEKSAIKLPSSARILKSVKLTYQNLDGSIEDESLTIDKNIDWHDEFVLTIKGKEKSVSENIIHVNPLPPKESQKSVSEIKQPVAEMPKKTQPTEEINTTKVTQKSIATPQISKAIKGRLSFMDFVSFDILKNEIKIITDDEKIRDLLVSQPCKIVIDFKRDASFFTKKFELNSAPFVSIVLGNHNGYYRVVIELDGQYRYDTIKQEDGYLVRLK
ncbi:MAG: AMIN domain-containing protein [Sulfurospirillaceae bacterium]|nr:AMIN domain-containing protein [Sulfurospirillaceae bacterium]